MKLDETHDPRLTSWVASANRPGSDFPIQNLPFGVFRRRGGAAKARGGVAIGDQILDLAGLEIDTGPTLNGLAALGRRKLRALRRTLSLALSTRAGRKRLERWLVPMAKAELLLPVAIGDYTDFYTSVFHATNVGRLFRPDNPLMPNFKWLPVAYHGRASSVVVSGTPVKRPHGQAKSPEAASPSFGPSRRLDYEVELGFVVGRGNDLGKPIALREAEEHLFGVLLLNDWSARDIQAWEYQPLGPFLGKSFATTVSPWIVTLDALEPYRVPAFARAPGDPAPLPYLADEANEREGMFSIDVEMSLRSAKMRAGRQRATRLSRGNYASCYWTPAQLVAHHASNGCNLRPGDLLGSGTISGPGRGSLGALLELTLGGKEPVSLPNGERRGFVEDGDELVLTGRCERTGQATIGFGQAAGRVV